MAFDGIITRGIVKEMKDRIILGKIEKIYQPVKEELVLNIHTKNGSVRLFASASSSDSRVHFIKENPANPPVPLAFCMLMRKHLSGGRIVDISQHGCERIIEISLETVSELGFNLSKKLIFEIMGRHSNIILVDCKTGAIIDSIKRVSIDTSRARQILPGKIYEYPPAQDKISFDDLTEEQALSITKSPGTILGSIAGISPAVASELSESVSIYTRLKEIREEAESGSSKPHIYHSSGNAIDYHTADLKEFETSCERTDFDDLSSCIDAFFAGKASSGRARQRSMQLSKNVQTLLDKAYLKKKRLNEDILAAEDSEHLRLKGELLTANLHLAKSGASSVTVFNYYDGSDTEIPLDPRYSASKNAQNYFKKYGKSKTALKEKALQLEETDADITYLESVLTYLDNLERPEEIELLRLELTENGYIRKRNAKDFGKKPHFKAQPYRYASPSGFEILAGRNNKENDWLTFKSADKTDIWLHTKDIPGSHVILKTAGVEYAPEDIYCAASVAAWHSKGRTSSNVPVDYVNVRYVKKPAGAKPGMVIFTNNRTVYVDPKLPE